MAWTYSGDPSSSELDRYRFLIGDTDVDDKVLQDEEINFIIAEYPDNASRMYHLFSQAVLVFGRAIKRTLGPQSEDPSVRTAFFSAKAKEYEQKLISSSGLTQPISTPIIFRKGMHDNV
jgi:hypothetical protein